MAGTFQEVDPVNSHRPYPRGLLERLLQTPAGVGLTPRGFTVHPGESGPCVKCGDGANTKNPAGVWEHHEILCQEFQRHGFRGH